jgi:uncharacterized membrane protein SpoIIM required for sporulation
MKESRFIAQNKEKWHESETLLDDSVKDPEKLSNLFTQVIDDLSYSRTYYPNRSVRVYLNKIAREYFSIIYRHQNLKKNAFRTFWIDEIPQIVFFSRKALLISLAIFLLSASIGVFSAVNDPHFTSSILGESYVAMTKENIQKGDPMAVYKKGHQMDMFLGITFNNLMVAFRTYVLGIFFSVGTVAILIYNGVMVGCFQFFFVERGLMAESALTIWLHGTLEISSIILAGGAGLTLGSGLLLPGTYSRLQAFQISAIRSLKLMLGITPIFVLAAIIESFLTRYTEVPDFIRLFLILLSAFFIIGYFVIYPWLKFRKGSDHPLPEAKLPASIVEPLTFDRIQNNAEIIKDAFALYKKYFGKLFSWITVVTLLMTIAEFFSPEPRNPVDMFLVPWQAFLNNLYYAVKTPYPVYIFINGIGSALIVYVVLMLMDNEAKNTAVRLFRWKSLFQTLAIVTALYAVLYGLGGWGILLVLVTFGLFLLYAYVQHSEEGNLVSSFSQTWRLSSETFGQVMGLQCILLLMSFTFLLILSAPLLYMNTSILQWNFAKSDVWAKGIVHFVAIFVSLLVFNLILPVFTASAGFLYFSLREIVGAENLRKAILKVGAKNLKPIQP